MILIWSIGNFKHQLNSKLIFVGLLLFICMDNSNSVTFEQEVTLSESQLMALQEFKQRVIPKLKVDYMKEDIYLVKWLRAHKFDVEKAVDFLNRHLSWRDNTNFDKLDDSYFQEFINEYPYEIVGQDKEGKPILHCYLGDWDFRKAALAGKMDKLIIYTSRMFNDAWMKVRELQQQGQNVTRYSVVIDVGKMNVRQHINPASMPFYVGVVLNYELNFPKQGDNIWVVNTPRLFEVAITLAKTVMDEDTKAVFKVFGTNREEWINVFRERIGLDQLTKPFGGTMPSKFEL